MELILWRHADASARRIFGSSRLGLSDADTIYEAIRLRGGLSRPELFELFQRNLKAERMDAALHLLATAGKLRKESRPSKTGKGRTAEVWECA